MSIKIKEIVKEKDLLADIAAEKAVDFLRENCVSKQFANYE